MQIISAQKPAPQAPRDFVSVLEGGGIGIVDGVQSNQAGIVAAVASAYSQNIALFWPAGTYVSTANIPNFHKVKHMGPGLIKRGASLYAVQGSAACALYVATNGDAGNDGLTPDVPMVSLQNAFAAVANAGPLVTQKFQIYMAAGTYAAPQALTHYTPSLQYVEVYGADVGGGRNVPTTIIDGAGGAVYAHGVYAQGFGVRLKVQDVKLINFNNGGGAAGDRTRGGVVFDRGAEGWTKNVHVTAASWFGIYATSSVLTAVESGIYDGCRIAINTDRSRVTVGWNALVAGSARPLIKNSTEQGVAWTNGTQGHVDYTDFVSNAIGLHLEGGSRCDAVQSDFQLNTIAVECFPGGFFGNNPSAPCTFNTGTANANTTEIRAYASGGDYNGLLKNSVSESRIDQYRGVLTITGTTAETAIYSSVIPAGFFKDSTQTLRVRVYGVITTAASPATIRAKVAGVQLADMVMPANAIAGQGFKMEIELFSNGAGNHFVFQRLIAGTASVDRVSAGSFNWSFAAGAQNIDLTALLAAAGDNLKVYRVEVLAAG